MYTPPFSITNNMLSKCISIAEKLGKISIFNSLKRMPILRKNNRIKSIHSSLAFEANSLSLNQVRDVIMGKTVIGPKKEIQEVKNAYKAYEMINDFDCYNEKDLLKAHETLTYLIENDSGQYRNHAEGVFDGEQVIFVAPSEKFVPALMHDLFDWLKNDLETPMLIKSCVFHYEFVFIHPFCDGNGRIARLWHTTLLSKWKPIFEYIPLESQIEKFQDDYYSAIAKCHVLGESTLFIEFMLSQIDKILDDISKQVNEDIGQIAPNIKKLLDVMEDDVSYSSNELMQKLNLKAKEGFRRNYLRPAIDQNLIYMTIPDKPKSKNQRYIKV